MTNMYGGFGSQEAAEDYLTEQYNDQFLGEHDEADLGEFGSFNANAFITAQKVGATINAISNLRHAYGDTEP